MTSLCQGVKNSLKWRTKRTTEDSSSAITVITEVTVVLVRSAENRAEVVSREAAAEVTTQREGEEGVKEADSTTTLRDLVVVMDRENLATTRESR